MAGSFSDYEVYFEKAYKYVQTIVAFRRVSYLSFGSALEPGGYFELQDFCGPFDCDDGTLTEDTLTYQFGQLMVDAGAAYGRPMDIAPTYKDLMAKAGFVDVVERRLKWPLGAWPKDKYFKDLGYWYYRNLDVGLEGLLMALMTREMGWSKEEVMVYAARLRPAFRDPRVHAYLPM